MIRSRRARRIQTAAALAAVALTLALAQQPVRGAFNGSTASAGSQASTAASFCTTPGNQTVTATADSFVDQGSPTSSSGGSATFLVVTPQTAAARRILVRFDPLPTIPSRCTVTAATLQIFAESQVAGRTLGAYRADPGGAAWSEAALTWNNQPAALGTAATAVMPNSDQYVSWTVTPQVKDLYALGNNGFVVRDQDETGTGAWQQFNSRAVATNKPQLYVAWG
jgi:hypothetical protein